MITIPYFTALTTYFSYWSLFAFGVLDWWSSSNIRVYAPICLGFEDFYVRRLYLSIQDCFGRPITSAPDSWFDVVERHSNDNSKTLSLLPRMNIALCVPSSHSEGFLQAPAVLMSMEVQELKRYLKYTCPAHLYATSISPPAAQQIMSAIKVILGEDGAQKLARICENSSNLFRSELQKLGFEVLGDNDSPAMPIMLYKLQSIQNPCLFPGNV